MKKKVRKKAVGKRKVLKKKKRVSKKKVAKKKKLSSTKVKAAKAARGVSLEEVGVITHYFPHVDAAVVKMTKGTLSIGDKIIVKGHTSDFKEKVDSMQLDHVPITNATPGQEIGLKVKAKVREHDLVYKVLA